jgi:hypothetical protein
MFFLIFDYDVFNIVIQLWFYTESICKHCPSTGVDPGFVQPESYTNLGALFKEKNTKLQIQNLVQK